MQKIIHVTPLKDYQLKLEFQNQETRIFDTKPYLDKGIFVELKNIEYFNKARIFFDSIAWPNGQDFDPDCLYIESRVIESPISDHSLPL